MLRAPGILKNKLATNPPLLPEPDAPAVDAPPGDRPDTPAPLVATVPDRATLDVGSARFVAAGEVVAVAVTARSGERVGGGLGGTGRRGSDGEGL